MRDLSRPLAPTYGDPVKKAAKKKYSLNNTIEYIMQLIKKIPLPL